MKAEIETFNASSLGEHDLVIVKVEQIEPETIRLIAGAMAPKMKFPKNLIIVTKGFDIKHISERQFNQMGFYRKPEEYPVGLRCHQIRD